MNECIFCKIANKSLKAFVVYDDEDVIAFLDVYPRSKGMTIVIPKSHYSSFEENPELSKKVFEIAEYISLSMRKALNAKLVGIGILPSAVQHFHIKVYPYYEDQIPLIENKPLENVKEEELAEIANNIKNNIVIPKKKEEEIVEEKKEEESKQRTKKDVEYIRRELEIA